MFAALSRASRSGRLAAVGVALAVLILLAGCGDERPRDPAFQTDSAQRNGIEQDARAADGAGRIDPWGAIEADVLYVGEHILTMDETLDDVTALAIRDQTIVWAGAQEDWQGSAARIVELGERALLPGFIDTHGHLAFVARTVDLANVASPPVGPVTDMASLQDTLRDYLDDDRPAAGEWVVGIGYDDSLLAEQRHPTRDDLDAVSSDHPIALIHVSAHLMTLNSAALEQVGIDAASADPEGGVIRRRPGSDEPSGVLEETAMGDLLWELLGDADSLTRSQLDAALQTYAGHGITTVQDSAASWALHERLAELAAEDRLPLDVLTFPVAMDPEFALRDDLPLGEYRDRLKWAGVKLLLDGSPQGRTAYLAEPYHQPPDGEAEDYRGYPMITPEHADALVARFLEAGVPMQVHANGDAAAGMLIDAIAAAADSAARGADHRTVMIHAQTVRDDQLDAMAELGIIPSFFSAHVFYWGDWHRDVVLGPERAARISPTASALERGLPFTLHNDPPVVPPDMLRLLWATTHRETRSGEILGQEQRIGVKDALRAITLDAAFQSFEEDRKGSLTPGKQADLVILSANPLDVDPSRLQALEVLKTVSRGAVIHDAMAEHD